MRNSQNSKSPKWRFGVLVGCVSIYKYYTLLPAQAQPVRPEGEVYNHIIPCVSVQFASILQSMGEQRQVRGRKCGACGVFVPALLPCGWQCGVSAVAEGRRRGGKQKYNRLNAVMLLRVMACDGVCRHTALTTWEATVVNYPVRLRCPPLQQFEGNFALFQVWWL